MTFFDLMGPVVQAAGSAAGSGGDAAGGAALAGLFGMLGMMYIFVIAFYCFVIIIALIALVLWVWMLIDCLKRDDFSGENDKLLWALVLLLGGFLGAIIYYFVIMRARGQPRGSSAASQGTAPGTSQSISPPEQKGTGQMEEASRAQVKSVAAKAKKTK